MTAKTGFAAWLDALEIPTERIELCTDHRLVQRATELHEQLERERRDKTKGGASLGDTSTAEELAAVRKEVEAKSSVLVVRAPSEDAMLAIEELRETDSDEWVASVIAASAVDPELSIEDVKTMRAKLPRGTWNVLFRRVLDVAVNRSLSTPFSWGDSGNART